MAEVVYVLCAIMSIACAFLLFRQYRQTPSHLLLWSCLCFVGLALNNIVLVVDLVLLPEIEFNGSFWRNFLAAISGFLLLVGLIWEMA